MGLQAAVHLGHMPWALTKEEEEEAGYVDVSGMDDQSVLNICTWVTCIS
jgi:hypothetical protein